MQNYYQKQLDQVNAGNKNEAPSIKIFSPKNGQDTKHISLNEESATALIEWLRKNYINK
jgi:hypothetical protein